MCIRDRQSVDKKSLSVIARPEKTVLKVSTSEDGNIVMKSRLLTVKLDTKTGVLIYETRNGMPLLKELELSLIHIWCTW